MTARLSRRSLFAGVAALPALVAARPAAGGAILVDPFVGSSATLPIGAESYEEWLTVELGPSSWSEHSHIATDAELAEIRERVVKWAEEISSIASAVEPDDRAFGWEG